MFPVCSASANVTRPPRGAVPTRFGKCPLRVERLPSSLTRAVLRHLNPWTEDLFTIRKAMKVKKDGNERLGVFALKMPAVARVFSKCPGRVDRIQCVVGNHPEESSASCLKAIQESIRLKGENSAFSEVLQLVATSFLRSGQPSLIFRPASRAFLGSSRARRLPPAPI